MTEPRPCLYCGKTTPDFSGYCGWDCQVAHARADGAVDHRPNGLPVACITATGLLLECEHGDHPDYKFPVDVEGVDSPDTLEKLGHSMYPEYHALIYTDGYVAVTMYECCYAMWSVESGAWLGGFLWDKTNRLSEASRAAIAAWCARNGKEAR